MILTADWHLTDAPADEYRWKAFEHVSSLVSRFGDEQLFILGDLCDRKDRHSAALVNRVIENFRILFDRGLRITVLMGNHDQPLNGPPFWQFMKHLYSGKYDIEFVTQPTANGKLLLLPYAADPAVEWKTIPFHLYHAIFMHQTVTGVKSDNGFVLENNKMPIFPRGIKIYSGDIHTPQVVGKVTYVGAPHPIKFGDSYPCRMLKLDDHYKISHEEILRPTKKLMLDISSPEDLELVSTSLGDQVRIRVALPVSSIEDWPAQQERITAWAQSRQVDVASVEATVEAMRSTDGADTPTFDADPLQVLELFCAAEGIDASLLETGQMLLREALGD